MRSEPTGSMAKNLHFARAFTLIELLVVIAVIAVLVSIAYPVYTGILERGKATKDMSNLRQIGIATQAYLNDSDGVFFSPATPWTSQLELNQKYLSAWRVLQSPFDGRPSSESGTLAPVSPISYGVNANIYPPGGITMSATKITKPTAFILFAPAQTSAATVTFAGWANTPAPGVTLLGNSNTVTSNPGGVPIGGTQSSRQRINALFADLHVETMSWSGTGPAFTNTTATPTDPDGASRWNP
jgi:prepilin-type N-terminal cleavage/methylation domain-containing protein/prepilin-type processing-associated H-X9-DG protein